MKIDWEEYMLRLSRMRRDLTDIIAYTKDPMDKAVIETVVEHIDLARKATARRVLFGIQETRK